MAAADWRRHLRWRRREAAYVMRHSKGGVGYRDIMVMEPDEVTEWSKAFEWLLNKEYPDK
jgi:ABC-type antimicrobial peptide transport system ATPase subunit